MVSLPTRDARQAIQQRRGFVVAVSFGHRSKLVCQRICRNVFCERFDRALGNHELARMERQKARGCGVGAFVHASSLRTSARTRTHRNLCSRACATPFSGVFGGLNR